MKSHIVTADRQTAGIGFGAPGRMRHHHGIDPVESILFEHADFAAAGFFGGSAQDHQFAGQIEFLEHMIPIFARELEQKDKELDEYHRLKAAVLSATDIEAMVEKLLAD